MASYLPPINISDIFNISDFNWQDGFIVYKDADHRYLRPIQNLQQKTSGVTYNDATQTLNISKNINVYSIINSVESTTRNNGVFGESVSVGSNLVVGKNIVNNGDIFTNNVYATSVQIKDAVIQNTILTNAFIDNVQIKPRALSLIANVTSDVQVQLDTNAKKKGDKGDTGDTGASIKGDKGDTGDTGASIKGDNGDTGNTGASIKCDKGDTGNTGAAIKGTNGDTGNTSASIHGDKRNT